MMAQSTDKGALLADTSESFVTSNVSSTTNSIKSNSDFAGDADDAMEQITSENENNFVVKGIVKDADNYLELGKEINGGDCISTEQLLSICKEANREDGSVRKNKLTIIKNYSKVNVYFTSIPPSWNTAQLKHLCKRFGPIVSATVAHHPHYNTSLGYGFVLFVEPASAARCVEELTGPNAPMYGGIRCRYAQDKATPYIVQLKQLKQKRMEAEATSLGTNNSQPYDGNSIEINSVLSRELSDEEVKLLMKEVDKEAAAAISATETIPGATTKTVASQLHVNLEELEYFKNDTRDDNNNSSNYNRNGKGYNDELRGAMSGEPFSYHPAHSLLANTQQYDTALLSNQEEENFWQVNMETNISPFSLPPPPPPPPPPYETIDIHQQEYMTTQFSLPPSPPCQMNNGYDASLFYSCPVESYEEPFHYAHSAPNNLTHLHGSYNEAVELQQLQYEQHQHQEQEQQQQQEQGQILLSTMISALAPREVKTTAVYNAKEQNLESVMVPTAPYVPNANKSFNSSVNKYVPQTLTASLQSQTDKEPLPMPTAIPTAIIEASALGKRVEELYQAHTCNLTSLTSVSNLNLQPNFSTKPSFDVQPMISSSAPVLMPPAPYVTEPLSLNTNTTLTGVGAPDVPSLMNLYGSSSSMTINGMHNSITATNSCNTNVNNNNNSNNNNNNTDTTFAMPTMGVKEANMLLHPLETLFTTTASSSIINKTAHANNNSFLTTNITNTIDARKANGSNLVNNVMLSNVNDSYNNSLSGANSFITHVTNSTDVAKGTNAPNENQFDLSKLQTRDGKTVMWGLPYMLAHSQANEKNDSGTDSKYSPFSVEGLSISSAPNALTTSSVKNEKLLSYLQANNEQNQCNQIE